MGNLVKNHARFGQFGQIEINVVDYAFIALIDFTLPLSPIAVEYDLATA